jgi:hypothetical protein
MRHYYYLHLFGDVEPSVHGPYNSAAVRDAQARRCAKKNPEDGVYKVFAPHGVQIDAYTGDELGRDT